MAETNFDVIVIGAGPGGYVAAIRAAQLGLKTACAESRETLGGTCLNVGCIPSKALLHASELFEQAAHGTLAKWGIKAKDVELDLEAMHAGRKEAVKGLTGGVEFLFRKNKVTWLKGHAKFTGPNAIDVAGQAYTAKNIVIATGSSVTPLPGVEIDQERIVDSTGALELDKVPGHLVVIGGGVIGLELGSVWRRLGAKVTVVEFLDQILPGMDGEVRKEAAKIFKKQGFDIRTSTKVTGAEKKGDGVVLTIEPAKGGEAQTVEADVVLVSIGRRPNTDGLGLEAAGIQLNKRGQIEVDHDFRTGVEGVYAIGDVIPGPMLAHKAEDEGIAVAEIRLHLPGDRLGRQDRGGAEGRRDRSEDRQVPDARQQPRQDQPGDGRLRQGHRRRPHRPCARRPYHRLGRRDDDRPGRAGDGVRGDQRGHRLYLPRPPDPLGGGQGGGDGGDGTSDPHLGR
jgi:dihydrolipoamide dehydrogenase